MPRLTFKSLENRVKQVGNGWCFQKSGHTYRDAEKYELFNNNIPYRGTVAGYNTLSEAEDDIIILEKGSSPF